jgi:hypothetical protein
MRPDSRETLPARVSEGRQMAALELLFSMSQPQAAVATEVLPVPPVPPAQSAPVRARDSRGESSGRARRLRIQPGPGLLFLVLAGQTYLSLRLVWSNTAFQDEALYLWAGRLEWAHWLHGAPIPPLSAYFSGAPVFYPPLAAAANAVGGLAAARILSLAFMLGATSLLWATTTRLYSRRAAFFACGTWAALGPTQRLGAFATFDAISLFLLALAAWCTVRAGAQRNATKWLLAAAGAALAANAAKYASVIFDPVVIALAGLTACPRPGGKAAAARWTAVLTYLATGIIALILIAGHTYSEGISATTLARATGQQGPVEVLTLSWQWAGAIIAVGACGAALSLAGSNWRPHRTLLLGLMVAAALLVPLEQARIHSTTSLDKHVAFGAWFAAIAAGYAADHLGSLLRSHAAQALLVGGLAMTWVPLAATGAGQARQFFGWPNAAAFIKVFRPLAEHRSGPMLVETSSVAQYYLPTSINWQQWSNTYSITAPSGQSVGYSTKGITDVGTPGIYRSYIKHSYFDLIALNYAAGSGQLDRQIGTWLRNDPVYRVVASARYGDGYYTVWQRVTRARRHRLPWPPRWLDTR